MSETTPEVLDRAEFVAGQAVVNYSRTEAALAELRQRHAGAVFDMTTTAGDKAARAARLELVTLRTALEKQRKAFKSPALEFGKKIDAEAARITAEIVALENPIDLQIKDAEEKKEAERAAKARAESDRINAHKANISAIRAYAEFAAKPGMTSDRLATGITKLDDIPIGPAYEEFEADANTAKSETLATMREFHAAAVQREADDAKREKERQELEQKRAEQAARQAELDRQAAEVKAQQEALARVKDEQDREDARRRALAMEAEATNPAAPIQMQPAPALIQAIDAATAVAFIPAPAVLATEAATLKLGDINARLAPISLTVAGLAELGFTHSATDKAAKLYLPSQFPLICDSLIKRITAAKQTNTNQ